jgi:DNA-binding transcriptional LysR family regulator
MDLDLAQVRAFVELAEQLHFGRAGANLFLTQQALSKRIRRLEQALGQQLVVRARPGVWLTEAGSRFVPYARRLLALAETASLAIRADDELMYAVECDTP